MATTSKSPVRRTRRTVPKPAGAAPAHPGPGIDLTDSKASSEPLLPHDRDEKVGITGGAPSPVVQQAARDVEKGLEDTSRAPEVDEAYRKLRK